MKKSSKEKRRQRGGFRQVMVPRPMSTPKTSVRILYQALAGTTPNIYTTDLFQSMFVNKVGTTANATLFGCIRLRRVSVWGPNPAAGAQTGVGFSFATGLITGWGDVQQHSAISTSSDRPAYVSARPNPQSGVAQWFSTTVASSILIEFVSCPTGTLIEISFDARLIDDGLLALAHTSIASGVVNSAYYGYLDFTASGASAKLQPVGVATLL